MNRTQVSELVRDVIPKEVAIEMVATPGVKLSGRERRMFLKSLEKHYVSVVNKKPREEKLAFKLQHCSWKQLNAWLNRTAKRFALAQSNYSKKAEEVARQDEKSKGRILGEKFLAQWALIISGINQNLDLLETEKERRENNITALAVMKKRDEPIDFDTAAKASAANKVSVEDVAL